MDKLTFRVSGMDCTACEERIRRALTQLEGVRHTSADHVTGTVQVLLEQTRTPAGSVRAAIEKAGFEVAT